MNGFIAGLMTVLAIVITGIAYGLQWLLDKFNNRYDGEQ